MASHSIKKLKLWRAGKRHHAQVAARFWYHDLRLTADGRQLEQLLQSLPPVKGEWPKGTAPLLFAVCDPPYFGRHAESLVASMARHAGAGDLHLHLYDPGQAQFDALVRFRQRYPEIRLSETWERTTLEGLNDQQRVIYFQSARFIRLYSLLRETGRPVVTVDVDSLVRGPLEAVVETADGADIGLFLRPDIAHSGKNVLASMVYAAPSEAGLHYFETVARHLAAHLIAGVQTEMLDQRCLWKVYQQQRARLRCWLIPQRFSDWELGRDSLIWHGKGPRKELPEYLRLKHDLVSEASPAGTPGVVSTTMQTPVHGCRFRVAWKPQNDEPRVASTRIRCLNPLQALQARGFPVELYDEQRLDDYDMVVFLKAYNENDVKLAEELRARGKIVIFDLCDNHFLMDEARVARLRRMFQLADHWVTSTPALADVIRENLTDLEPRPLHVISDAVEEHLITPPFDIRARLRARWQMIMLERFLDGQGHGNATHLVWFGTHQGSHRDSGLAHLAKLRLLLERLARHHPLTLTVISNSRDSFKRHCSGWRLPLFYMDWNPHNFFQAMGHHQIAVIPIQVNEFTKVKTNNRLAISLYLGLGVVADAIDSYREFSGCTILDDWEKGLETYISQPALMAAHVAEGRRIIAERYSLPVIADHWRDLFESAWAGAVCQEPLGSIPFAASS